MAITIATRCDKHHNRNRWTDIQIGVSTCGEVVYSVIYGCTSHAPTRHHVCIEHTNGFAYQFHHFTLTHTPQHQFHHYEPCSATSGSGPAASSAAAAVSPGGITVLSSSPSLSPASAALSPPTADMTHGVWWIRLRRATLLIAVARTFEGKVHDLRATSCCLCGEPRWLTKAPAL